MTDDEWRKDGVLNVNHTLTDDEFLRVQTEDGEDAVYLRRGDDGEIEIYRRTDLPENGSRPVSAILASYAALAKRMESHAVEAEETMGESGSPNIKNRYKGLAQGYREAARMLRECAA